MLYLKKSQLHAQDTGMVLAASVSSGPLHSVSSGRDSSADVRAIPLVYKPGEMRDLRHGHYYILVKFLVVFLAVK